MKIIFLKTFDKAYKKLSSSKQKQTGKTIEKLVYYIEESVSPIPKGLGLERRKGGYGYCRIDLYFRILFKKEKDTLIFYFLGTHKQIDTYIKNLSK